MHIELERNTKGVDYFVGDIHGCYDELMNRLTVMGFDKSVDRLISVGDLIDRGEKSHESLLLTKEDWFYAVRGNHESFVTDNTPVMRMCWLQNGGEWSEQLSDDQFKECQDISRNMPIFITVNTEYGKIGVSHSDCPDDWSMVEGLQYGYDEIQTALWGRTIIKSPEVAVKDVEGVVLTVHGHTPTKDIVFKRNRAYIDTGAVFGYSLTVISAEELIKKIL